MPGEDFKRVFEGSVDAELVFDERGCVVAASDGYVRAVGKARDEVVGRSVYALPPYAGANALADALRAKLQSEGRRRIAEPLSLEGGSACESGAQWGWGITRAVTDDAGRVRLFVHSLRAKDDGTALEEREPHLRKLIEHIYDTTALFDRYGRLTFVSPSITRTLGYSEAEFMALPPAAGIHPDDAARFGEELEKLYASPGGLMLVRFRARHKDGSYRTLECASLNLLHDPDVGAVVANFHDITHDVELEAELRRINQELQAASREREVLLAREQAASREREVLLAREQQANRTKDEFLAMLGHELRNPLSPILTALELMRMRNPDLMLKERTIIERQVHHLVGLVDDLLDVSRITRGKVELRRRTLEIAEVVAKAIEMTSPLLEQRKQELRVHVPPAGLQVHGDEMRLAQVVANLLNNAAKYTPSSGVIEISAELCRGQVVLEVSDTGRGIAAELLPRLFDQFVQGERTIDRSEGGLGLGLAIVRSLVELHGGTVSAASAGAGRGSRFTVQLPLASALERQQPDTPGAAVAPAALSAAEARRVLVVDDNDDAAELLSAALDTAGYAVRVAHDAAEALALAPEWKPDLAFLDIGLPVMDGYELARRMHAHPNLAEAKLVAITGYGLPQDRRRSAAAGFAEHLVKPVDLGSILAVAARLLPAAPSAPPRPSHSSHSGRSGRSSSA